MKDIEYRPWVVFSGAGAEVARYRYRGDAEAHAQTLRRLLPQGGFKVVFEVPVTV